MSTSQSQLDNMPDLNCNEEEASYSYALNTRKKAGLIKLLRRASMEVDDEGHLPPTPLVFEKLWAHLKL